jgi:transposase-like protein
MDATEFENWLSGIATLNVPQRRRAWETLALSEASDDSVAADTARPGEGLAGACDAAASGGLSALPSPKGASGRGGADLVAELGQRRVDRRGCPHCDSHEVVRWGQSDALPRYRCKACRRTFNALTKTPLAHLRMKEKWSTQAQALIDGIATAKAAERCGVDYKTAFRQHIRIECAGRHRFLKSLAGDNPPSRARSPTALSGVVESDETFILESFKGRRSDLPRKARKRGGKSGKRGLSAEQIPVIVARDRHGATTDAVLPKLNRVSIAAALGGIVTPANEFCCDGGSAIVAFARKAGIPTTSCRHPANRTRARRISTLTTSMRITAASRSGCAASTALPRKTCPIIWGDAEPWRRWTTTPRPQIGYSEPSG